MLDSLLKTLQAYTNLLDAPLCAQNAPLPHINMEPVSTSVSIRAMQLESLELDKVSGVSRQLEHLQLEQYQIPGAFPIDAAGNVPAINTYDIYSDEISNNTLETYLIMATLTTPSMDTQASNGLFSFSSEYYQQKALSLPDSLITPSISNATEPLQALVMPKTPSAAVRATPETAEDLTQLIPAGGKSKDIFNSVKKKQGKYTTHLQKENPKRKSSRETFCMYQATPQPHHMGHIVSHGHPQASDEGNWFWSGKHKEMMREMNDK
ncbi:hypothetical protein L218DRAFT_950821 [Marasmius fiardii PR-910]|nr:hypothetical protein L218DRAFT_950821 [Marasmius fiardii PR-910]